MDTGPTIGPQPGPGRAADGAPIQGSPPPGRNAGPLGSPQPPGDRPATGSQPGPGSRPLFDGPRPRSGGIGSLPPLTHTGEIPKQPAVGPPDAVIVAGRPSGAGVFDDVDRPSPTLGSDRAPTGAPATTGAMPMPGGPAMRDAFSDPTSAFPTGPAEPSTTGRSVTAPAAAITAARLGQPAGGTRSGRPVGRPRSGADSFDSPSDPGRAVARAGAGPTGRRALSDPADRLQDTEIKLAGRRRRQKPKEPNKLLLGLAVALVVLVGLGVAWAVTRDGGDGNTEAVETEQPDPAGDLIPVEETPVDDEAPAEPEPFVGEPTLVFEEAEAGPLLQAATYSIDLLGQPLDSQVQVVVDELPQGGPAAVLPDLILPAGRHTLYIEITDATGATSRSNSVEVYVLGDFPAAGYRANLSSVDILNEGWAEAIRQFDEFRSLGHENLQILPLSEGYWNIFVPELGEDSSGVTAYCESFGLAIPDACFAIYFDPAEAPDIEIGAALPGDGAPADGSAVGDGAGDSMIDDGSGGEGTEGESMTDETETTADPDGG